MIGDLAGIGLVSEVDGPHKQSGKTTFLAHAVAAKLRGADFLGSPTLAGPVVWLTEESWDSLSAPLQEAGIVDSEQLYVLCREDAFGVAWPEVARQARELCREVGANLLIGDTLTSIAGLRGDEENSSGASLEAVRPVQEIAAAGVAVICTRHERRAGGEVGETGRGSTAISGAMDMIFRLTRLGGDGRETLRKLEYIGRVRGVPAERIVELTEAGYVFLGTDSDLKRQEARSQLLDHLPDAEDEAITLPTLWARGSEEKGREPGPLAGSGIGKNTYYEAAEDLFRQGKLARRDINPKKRVWWAVSGAPYPTGHPPEESLGEAGGDWVSGAPSPYRDGHRTDTPPDATAADSERLPVGVSRAVDLLGGVVTDAGGGTA